MFKENWEKASGVHQLPEGIVAKMVGIAYPNKKFITYELIAGGCANTNIKIFLEHEKDPLILRVYLRDKNAVYREQKLGKLLKETIPIPLIYYIGEIDGYRFATMELMPGIPLRNLLLNGHQCALDLNTIMYEIGITLSKIAIYEFPLPGFLDDKLTVIPFSLPDDYLNFVTSCLRNEIVLSVLIPEIVSEINYVIEKYSYLFPDENEKHLVHADFDPANILVNKVDDVWKVSGVLDWEFAFSGSVLWDVASMLRYAHKMAYEFKRAFIIGLTSGGIVLPSNWEMKIKMLNLFSLLDCLKRSDIKNSPNRCSDILGLINDILADFRVQGDNI